MNIYHLKLWAYDHLYSAFFVLKIIQEIRLIHVKNCFGIKNSILKE